MAEEKANPTEQPSTQTAETPEQQPVTPVADFEAQVKELQRKLEVTQTLADTYKDQLLRKAAEFENYKKRAEADYVNMVKSANERLIISLIPILDDFRRSLKAGREVKDHDAFLRGIDLVYGKFSKLLESYGLTAFESVGKPFDAGYHDALLQAPRSDVPPHTVVEEMERGYKLFDKVIRHAKVIVSGDQSPEVPSNRESQGAEQSE